MARWDDERRWRRRGAPDPFEEPETPVGPYPGPYERSPNRPYEEGMASRSGPGQDRYGGIGGHMPLGSWDYRDLGGSGHGYRGPEPDLEGGPYRGLGPRGWVRSNEAIRDEVCHFLTEDSYVDARNIEVEVEDGEVTLRGTVASREQKIIADHDAHRVSGVRDVHNRLTIRRDSHEDAVRQTRREYEGPYTRSS